MQYNTDKEFSNYVHKKLAVNKIYKKLNWVPQEMNEAVITTVDILNAIDCFLIDMNINKTITIQERFRESKYRHFTDFTIRFEREYNPNTERILSEYYKLDADYFVYGITNGYKNNIESSTDFVKFAVIDLKGLKNLFESEKIIIDRNLSGIRCIEKNGKLICPVNYNSDYSSSFIPIDIPLLKKLFKKENIVIYSKGF